MKNTYTRPQERVILLDILRGWGIIGVALMNFVGIISMYNPKFGHPVWAVILENIFAAKSWMLLFVLFGYGIGESIERLKKESVISHFMKKFAVLALIAFFNIINYSGDILLDYVMIGLILLLFRNLSAKSLFIIFLFFALIIVPITHPIVNRLSHYRSDGSYEKMMAEIAQSTFPKFWIANLKALYVGNFLNLFYLVLIHLTMIEMGIFGMFLQKINFFKNISNYLPQIKQSCKYSFLVALTLLILRDGFPVFLEPLHVFFGTKILLYASSVIFFSSSIILLYDAQYFQRFFGNLSVLGRMSLTNYLTQNIFMVLVFSNAGLGFGKQMTYEYSIIMASIVLFLQFLFGKFWFKKHQLGPMEYVWRRLSQF
jgi:uncharacterized protein